MKRILLIVSSLLVLIVILGLGFIFGRQAWAARQAAQDWQTTVSPIINLGSTRTLSILPLVENESSRSDLQAEHGVSYLIKTDNATILFDIGYNQNATSPSPLEANMAALGISLDDASILFFSHNHPDHVGGTNWWRAGTFSLGNEQIDLSNKTIYVPEPLSYPGLDPIVATQPAKIAEGVASLGTIAFAEVFPVSLFRGKGAEQSLAINVEGKGIVLVTGCGHQGLEKMLARAQALFDRPVVGVVGGLHYLEATAADLQPEIDRLVTLNPQLVGLSPHDSGPAARQAFQTAFPTAYQEIKVGTWIPFDDAGT
jgi:metal-dependent hydrolase (beta-lactamase superfamily II)